MAQSTCSLSWKSHKNNICNGLGQFQQNGEFVDMTLAADGHHVKVHQMVMALASPYIKELIKSAATLHPIIFLNKTSYATLNAILEYIYTGEVLVEVHQIAEVLQAAEDLHIKGLKNLIHSFSVQESRDDPIASDTDDDNDAIKNINEDIDDTSENMSDDNGEISNNMSEDDYEISKNMKEDSDDTSKNMNEDFYETSKDMDEDMYLIKETKKNKKPREKLKYIDVKEGLTAEYSIIDGYKGDSRWFSRDGHYYVASRSRSNTVSMRCCSDKCPARWLLKDGHAGPVVNEHDHPPMPWVPNRNTMFQSLKRRATTETIPLNTMFQEEAARYPDAAAHLAWESVAPSMRKWRRLQPQGNKENVDMKTSNKAPALPSS